MRKLILFLFILTSNYLFSQKRISGTVMDSEGNPVINANITVVGKNAGVTTDADGRFEINFEFDKNDKIVISSVGYEKKILKIDSITTELRIILKEKVYATNEVVVTGTRNLKNLKDTPVRTELITEAEIKRCSYITLKDVLIEQNGMSIVDNHGSGIQIQGLDPEYTLILIDGEPAVGRTAGTLELSRFDVANLKQIEIVKGPSSSLYGSEALAGVINLITKFPEEQYKFSFNALGGTYDSYLVNAEASASYKNIKGSLFINKKGSDGYDLTPESISKTAPRYGNLLLNPKLEYKLNENNSFRINLRYFLENQTNNAVINESEDQFKILNDKDKMKDFNMSLTYEGKLSNVFNHQLKFYLSNYFTENLLSYQTSDSIYEISKFDQFYYKGEYFGNFINKRNLTSFGAGYVLENVSADRIDKNAEKVNSYFVYLQHEWIPSKYFDIIGGARYDYHSNYSSRISPKISAAIKPYDFLKINLSIGSGFKAPTLQQLYLNFTNPQVGYSVYGSTNFQYYLEKLNSEGQIDRILIDPKQIQKIKAEHSWSYNAGFTVDLKNQSLSINLFRNDINDLIDATPIAIKKNGQGIYTYLNLNKIYTQGIESDLQINLLKNLRFNIGYQYLEAIDKEVLDKIKAGEISKLTSKGRLRKVTESDYGGLFNRSKHSASVRIIYDDENLGLYSSITGIIKNRYGYYDKNGNGILDDDSEYSPGYAIWNFAFNKSLNKNFALHLRIENLLNKKLVGQIMNLPGRIIYAGISINYKEE